MVFIISLVIAKTIPNVLYQVNCQVALAKQLIAENKYKDTKIEKKGHPQDSYDEFLPEIRKVHDDDERGLEDLVNRHSWVRRTSRRISSNSLTSKLFFFTSPTTPTPSTDGDEGKWECAFEVVA